MKKHLSSRLPLPLKDFARLFVYRAEVLLQRAKFVGLKAPSDGWPVLMANSFPKSGTHLLDQILFGFSKVAPFAGHVAIPFVSYEGETGKKRSVQDALTYLRALRPLDVTTTHLLAWPEVVEMVCTPKFLPYLIFRDPRDIVVSHVFYVTDMEKNHAHSRYYNEVLKNFDERLEVSILGRPDAEVEFPDIAQRFELYRGWLDRPQVLMLHFEDLIHYRQETLGRIIDHFLRRVDSVPTPRADIITALETSINPHRSPTFRSGKTGEWKKYFTDRHKRLFKDVSGDLLVRLGYEKNSDW